MFVGFWRCVQLAMTNMQTYRQMINMHQILVFGLYLAFFFYIKLNYIQESSQISLLYLEIDILLFLIIDLSIHAYVRAIQNPSGLRKPNNFLVFFFENEITSQLLPFYLLLIVYCFSYNLDSVFSERDTYYNGFCDHFPISSICSWVLFLKNIISKG